MKKKGRQVRNSHLVIVVKCNITLNNNEFMKVSHIKHAITGTFPFSVTEVVVGCKPLMPSKCQQIMLYSFSYCHAHK